MKIIFLLALAASSAARLTSAKDVQVSMRGHWSDTSLVAEACEAVAELGGAESFWQCAAFVPSVVGQKPYAMATKTLAALVAPEALPVASVSLHSRRFSPLIASQFQLIESDLEGRPETIATCASPAMATANGGFHCAVTPEAAKSIIDAAVSTLTPKNGLYTTTTDKVYPATGADAFPITIYGILGHASTHDLLAAAMASGAPFIFRHHPDSTNSPAKLPMQGYGVFLDVKNTEYKTTDERGGKKKNEGEETIILTQDIIAGVNISAIARRFGGAAMTNTRARLSSLALEDLSIEETAFKVPFWHMSRATMQIVDYVMGGSNNNAGNANNNNKGSSSSSSSSSSSANATFERLADLTANFPMRMGAVLRAGDDPKREDAIMAAISRLAESVQPGTCTINVNGRTLREEEQDFFHVLDLIAGQERHLLALTAALEQHHTTSSSSSDDEKAENSQPTTVRLSLGAQPQLPHMIHHLGTCQISGQKKGAGASSGQNSHHHERRGGGGAGGQHLDGAGASGPRYWIDRDLVLWINNVEKDPDYQRLRPSYSEVLRTGPYYQPLFPRKNLFNLIYVLDAADSDTPQALRAISAYLRQGFAARFGVLFVDSAALGEKKQQQRAGTATTVPSSLSTVAMAALRAATNAGSDTAADFLALAAQYGATEEGIERAFAGATRKSPAALRDELASPAFAEYYAKAQAHAAQMGFRKFPLAVFNGLMFTSLDRVLFNGFEAEFEPIREWVRSGELADTVKDPYPWLMEKHGAVKRFQGLLNDPRYVRIPDVPRLAAVIAQAPYLYSKAYALEAILESNVLLLSADPSEAEWALLGAFSRHIANCGEACVRMRYTVAFGAASSSVSVVAQFITDLLVQLANGREERRIGVFADVVAAIDGARLAHYTRADLVELAKAKGAKFSPSATASSSVNELTAALLESSGIASAAVRKMLGLQPQQPAVLCNGRAVALDETFVEEDFGSLFDSEVSKIGSIGDCFERGNIHALYSGLVDADDVGSEFVAAKLASVASVMLSRQSETPAQNRLNLDLDPLTVRYGPTDGYRHTIEAAIDPTKRDGQRLVAMIRAIAKQVTSANVVIYLNPPQGMSDVSLTTFYRFVFDSTFTVADPDFSNELRAPVAHFVNLPSNIVFTMGVDEPEAWMVFADVAEADLDNIKLSDATETVTAEYGLHSILITGKCVDVERQTAPKSLPIVLQSVKRDDIAESDTTVMSNYAYFQLRARFGQWSIGIQPGEVAQRYAVVDLIETEANVYRRSIVKLRPEAQRTTRLMVSSFSGAFVHMQVRAVGGHGGGGAEAAERERQHIAYEEKRAERALAVTTATEAPTLNIFSVASGHLYERFLRMMFHTVVKTAREARDKEGQPTRVKFWLIENFLSPRFKKFLPGYAAKQGFEYQFVSYHWPHWLRRQTQKQRTIWAYKILFLDVLFPLGLDKVIFVDADQIVRADLHELYNLDLEGNPMAYTPFCRQNMNEATKGFRFWDSGFWVDHLRGSPYHISAIYVVDLKRLRAMYGGDHYRMVYEQLSADPNSLSNLDQDLPNYVQHQVPIFSLPEEWLWCETWCNGASKARAKTIDLCNNPQTKIPKLENAKLIIPEWAELDESLGSF